GLELLLEILPLHRVRHAVDARALAELRLRDVRDRLPEGANLRRRAGLEAVIGFRHLLGCLREVGLEAGVAALQAGREADLLTAGGRLRERERGEEEDGGRHEIRDTLHSDAP